MPNYFRGDNEMTVYGLILVAGGVPENQDIRHPGCCCCCSLSFCLTTQSRQGRARAEVKLENRRVSCKLRTGFHIPHSSSSSLRFLTAAGNLSVAILPSFGVSLHLHLSGFRAVCRFLLLYLWIFPSVVFSLGSWTSSVLSTSTILKYAL